MTESTAQLAGLDVTDVEAIREALGRADPEGRLHPLLMRRIEIGQDAVRAIPDVVAELSPGPAVAVLMDGSPIMRGGESLKEIVLSSLEGEFKPRLHELADEKRHVHADEETLAAAVRALKEADCLVVVGSGTVTDIAKEASRNVGCPLVVVQTAAAVNAFSDDMAVIQQSGVKRTVRSKWPDALVADLTVIAGAPNSMTLAGFGDMCGIWTAPADWYLASAFGLDDSYHPAPLALFEEPGARMLAAAPGLPHGEPAAIDSLIRMLTISGIALGVAGTTAPLSGTEHLISHLLDLDAQVRGRRPALHGAQVGVASVIAAAVWEVGLEELDASMPVEQAVPSEAEVERALRAGFSSLDSTGRVASECWSDCRRKLVAWGERRDTISAAISDWDSHREVLRAQLAPPDRIAEALRQAEATTSFDRLSPPIPSETVRWAAMNLPFIRSRFTIADLLFYSGRWSPELVDRALARTWNAGIRW